MYCTSIRTAYIELTTAQLAAGLHKQTQDHDYSQLHMSFEILIVMGFYFHFPYAWALLPAHCLLYVHMCIYISEAFYAV